MSDRVFFPLRSNAKSLLAGPGVESVRRRLKLASLLFNEVLIEDGGLNIQAGPDGSITTPPHLAGGEELSWQRVGDRRKSQAGGFYVSFGTEEVEGVPAPGPYATVINSQSTISWSPTFRPFVNELPRGTDWIDVVQVTGMSADVKRTVDRWARRDREGSVLKREAPVDFVRGVIIKHANTDLGAAIDGAVALSTDALHGAVVRCRVKDTATWRMKGLALPLIFPHVPNLAWEDIQGLRKDPNLVRYRAVLSEIESEVLAVSASNDDVERAMHRMYETKLREANTSVEKLGSSIARELVALGVAVGSGFATMPLSAPLGPLLGAVPTLGSGLLALSSVVRRRRTQGWLAFDARLQGLS